MISVIKWHNFHNHNLMQFPHFCFWSMCARYKLMHYKRIDCKSVAQEKSGQLQQFRLCFLVRDSMQCGKWLPAFQSIVLHPVILKLESAWCTYYLASNTEDHSLKLSFLNRSVLRAKRTRYHFHQCVMQCIIVLPFSLLPLFSTFIKMLILFI